MRKLIAIAFIIAATVTNVWASDMRAKIKVSGGGTYDYFIVGEMDGATDGFDNAYDSLYPAGNMNETYIMSSFYHPEWAVVKSEFRADTRSVADIQQWDVDIYTNLPNGTMLTMSLMEGSKLPADYTLTIEDTATGQQTDMRTGEHSFTVTDNTSLKTFKVTAIYTSCSFAITPMSKIYPKKPKKRHRSSVSVTATAGCQWTATSNASWIMIRSGNTGTGNGTVAYRVSKNKTKQPRTGTMSIAGQTFTVEQLRTSLKKAGIIE